MYCIRALVVVAFPLLAHRVIAQLATGADFNRSIALLDELPTCAVRLNDFMSQFEEQSLTAYKE